MEVAGCRRDTSVVGRSVPFCIRSARSVFVVSNQFAVIRPEVGLRKAGLRLLAPLALLSQIHFSLSILGCLPLVELPPRYDIRPIPRCSVTAVLALDSGSHVHGPLSNSIPSSARCMLAQKQLWYVDSVVWTLVDSVRPVPRRSRDVGLFTQPFAPRRVTWRSHLFTPSSWSSLGNLWIRCVCVSCAASCCVVSCRCVCWR